MDSWSNVWVPVIAVVTLQVCLFHASRSHAHGEAPKGKNIFSRVNKI